MAIEAYFKNIADAIREKTGGSAVITPGQMPQAILDLPAGGVEWLTPLHTGVKNGYVDQNGAYVVAPQSAGNVYVYDLANYDRQAVFIFKKTLTGTLNNFRISAYAKDPATLKYSVSAQTTNHRYDDNTYNNAFRYYNVLRTIAESYTHYLAVYTGPDALEHKIFVGVATDLLQ